MSLNKLKCRIEETLKGGYKYVDSNSHSTKSVSYTHLDVYKRQALDITTIDPLKYNLIFERFLNPDRISMPDIDIDFCYERRGEVIEYVIGKYGEDRVAQIITFGTMAARAAIRDVGRALNLSLIHI